MAGSLPLRPVLARGAMRYPGEVSERFKEHAWKVCVRQKRTEGSNPSLSASQIKMGPKAPFLFDL